MMSASTKKILHIAGARPNFMKVAPVIEAFRRYNESARHPVEQQLIHTGQHYDESLSQLFFTQLQLPRPDVNLDVGSGSHAVQTAEIMRRFEPVCLREAPTHIVVVGDVNSTIACALVGAKLQIPVAHIEAGLRSFNRAMPEEINRVLTDAISSFLFTTEPSAERHLRAEGVAKEKIFFVGNVMIDTLLRHRDRANASTVLRDFGLTASAPHASGASLTRYGVVTLHRPSNVDDRDTLSRVLQALTTVAREIPLIFPLHPRTKKMLKAHGLSHYVRTDAQPPFNRPGLYATSPLGYLDFLCLMSHARLVLTDSGGIQEETTALGVPCVTLREETERPVTITDGTNMLAGTTPEKIIEAAMAALQWDWTAGTYGGGRPPRIPDRWDGLAADRIVNILTAA
ncbi:MAG: UDP-N-acetylglucosamine 2-epimerase (non-hydrolyzing) [Nitrospirota bacterium]